MKESNRVTYVSNAGVLIKMKDKKILIDGLCSSKIQMYKSTPKEICKQMIEGVPPFDHIDLMLITHHHSDHFDINSTCQFLKQNSKTVVISTHEVISKIRNLVTDTKINRFIELKPKLHQGERIRVDGIDILAFSMIHEGKEYTQVDNLAYLIEYGKKVLHLGDAAYVKENYESLKLHHYGVDLLIANFPYVSVPSARQIIKEYINPQKIASVHMPYKELDRFGWINATKKSYDRVKDRFIQTEFLEDVKVSISI